MAQVDNRDDLLKRDMLLVGAAAVSLLNGMHFSPYFEPVFILLKPFIAGTLLSTPLVLFYITSVFISLMTLLIAGIPAALYERLRGQGESNAASLGIWLGGTLLLASPSLMSMAGR